MSELFQVIEQINFGAVVFSLQHFGEMMGFPPDGGKLINPKKRIEVYVAVSPKRTVDIGTFIGKDAEVDEVWQAITQKSPGV